MATEKLLGRDDESGTSAGPNYWRMHTYVALKSGTISEIKLRSNASGNVKVAIYADKAGEPGELLGANNDGQAVTSGWNTLTIDPTPIIKGTHYWLATMGSATGFVAYKTGGSMKYKAATYSTFSFPDPAGSGFSSFNGYCITAAWGETAIRLLGTTDNPGTQCGGNIFRLTRFTAQLTGTMTQFRVYSGAAGLVKVAIYADNAGTPGLRLNRANYSQAVAPGWNTLVIPATDIVAGTDYWLADIENGGNRTQYIATGSMKYIGGQDYDTFTFPNNPHALGTLSSYNGYTLLAGWGLWVPGPIVILDAQYITETPEVNRAYVIGRDAEGNPVHGTDLEQSEIDLVGERLDFQQHLTIPTSSLAADVADAMLKKQRLSKHRGFITIPPNCGAELWDVIQVTDTPCAQSASKYRILAISFDYQPRQRRYHHKLFLAAR